MQIEVLNKKARSYLKDLDSILSEVSKVIVGQEKIIRRLIICLIADGHVLLEGVPGLAKTLMIQTLADTLHASFRRIQFTPDLLPADILGTKIYNQKTGTFYTKKGPIFANFILADEVNRAPPKVQSALLESMQERQVTISGETYPLPKPFFVMATQNPIESEGTYRLPEAQLDRFMFKSVIKYPSSREEEKIINRMTGGNIPKGNKILDLDKLVKIQKFLREIYVDQKIIEYVTRIVCATRSPSEDVKQLIEYGASPRASIYLILGAKANALLNGRGYVKPEDVKEVAYDVLRHRIILTYEAEAEEVSTDDLITKILQSQETP